MLAALSSPALLLCCTRFLTRFSHRFLEFAAFECDVLPLLRQQPFRGALSFIHLCVVSLCSSCALSLGSALSLLPRDSLQGPVLVEHTRAHAHFRTRRRRRRRHRRRRRRQLAITSRSSITHHPSPITHHHRSIHADPEAPPARRPPRRAAPGGPRGSASFNILHLRRRHSPFRLRFVITSPSSIIYHPSSDRIRY